MGKKKSHGGKRVGAGRKPLNDGEKSVLLTATVPGELAEQLETLREKEGWTRSFAIAEAIRSLLSRRSR